MKTNTSARISSIISGIMFAVYPIIIFAICPAIYYPIKYINSDLYTIIGGVIAFIVGSSFTASTLLITMPRENKYLKRLDDRNLIMPYTAVLLIPCILGTISFIMMFVCQQSNNQPIHMVTFLTTLSIYSTFFQFIWSIIILFLILYRASKSN